MLTPSPVISLADYLIAMIQLHRSELDALVFGRFELGVDVKNAAIVNLEVDVKRTYRHSEIRALVLVSETTLT